MKAMNAIRTNMKRMPKGLRRAFAWSRDGGEIWQDAGHDSVLPDGPRYRGEQRRGSNYNGHFGMMCGLTRLPVEGRDVLIYSNADTPDHSFTMI